ncbi:MAG: tetraacyldisaccharide 4'-kinase [Planctomycetota bacterium]|jgi:tetraacyldisaccharide 4'-kinase
MGRRADHFLAQRGGFVEFLRIPAACFGVLSWLRARLYDSRFFPVLRVDVPVISIGNLSVGGTGKTPFVEWMIRHFEDSGVQIGVLARGYGRKSGELLNDEGRMLAEAFPDILQEQNPDRVAAALRLLDRGVDGVVMDDGFQHRRLHRDLDIVLIDATRPFGLSEPDGGGDPVQAFLPRGFLREGPSALKRAHCVVLTRCDGVSPEQLTQLKARMKSWAPKALLLEAVHRAVALQDPEGDRQPLEALKGQRAQLISGIGNPSAFEGSAKQAEIEVAGHLVFADHHAYESSDLVSLVGDSSAVQAPLILTTAKDWPKLKEWVPQGSTWVLLVEMELVTGEQDFLELLASLSLEERAAQRTQDRATMHAGLHG